MVPNPFCGCHLCQRIRAGEEIPRKRSALLIDPELCIDFGPDVLAASQQYQAPFYDLKDILITHTHADHLSVSNLEVLTMTERGDRHIRLWLSPEGVRWLELYRQQNRVLHRGKCGLDEILENGWLSIHALTPYTWHQVGDARVFAVSSNHPGNGSEEYSLNYVVEKKGKRLLYAADTGLYGEENLCALQNFEIDTVVMEGTYGSLIMDPGISHLTCEIYLTNAENLALWGAVKPNARFFVTHINQCHSFTHGEYEEYMRQNSSLNITTAYDGMRVIW